MREVRRMHDQSRAVGGRGEFLPELIRTLSCKDGEEADVIGGERLAAFAH